jgi:hypothetical protein
MISGRRKPRVFIARVANAHPYQKNQKLGLQMYRGANGNKERNLLKLGEISPLELSNLGSKLGSIERVFGLINAERIGNLKM